MTERRYYICDRIKKTRLRKTYRKLKWAVSDCRDLNDAHDEYLDKQKARYFCGDWCAVKMAVEFIDDPMEWPWEKQQ